MKKKFLVAYDYGMGGVWAVVNARSPDEITRKYAFLVVQESQPAWMTDAYYEQVASARTHDIDDDPSGWLLSLQKSESNVRGHIT